MKRLSNGGIVVAWAADRFEAFFADAARHGAPAGNLRGACYSRGGHQWNSKHHWGGACDGWGQTRRNRMARHHLSPQLEIQLARAHGLESGCEFYRDRRGPDCGHIQVRGSTSRQYALYMGGLPRYAARHRERYRLAAYRTRYAGHHRRRLVAI
jgi:hypothetical protein